GLLTQDNLDAQLWRRFGTSQLARTVCAAPTGAANQALYGKMPSVTYQDYPEAALIILWGVNPSASGIHLVPYVRDAQKRGAKLGHGCNRAGAGGEAVRRELAGAHPVRVGPRAQSQRRQRRDGGAGAPRRRRKIRRARRRLLDEQFRGVEHFQAVDRQRRA